MCCKKYISNRCRQGGPCYPLQINNIPHPAIIMSKSAVLSSEEKFENSIQSIPSTGEFHRVLQTLCPVQHIFCSLDCFALAKQNKWLLIHLCLIKKFPVLSRSSCESSCMNTSFICFVKCCGLVNFRKN